MRTSSVSRRYRYQSRWDNPARHSTDVWRHNATSRDVVRSKSVVGGAALERNVLNWRCRTSATQPPNSSENYILSLTAGASCGIYRVNSPATVADDWSKTGMRPYPPAVRPGSMLFTLRYHRRAHPLHCVLPARVTSASDVGRVRRRSVRPLLSPRVPRSRRRRDNCDRPTSAQCPAGRRPFHRPPPARPSVRRRPPRSHLRGRPTAGGCVTPAEAAESLFRVYYDDSDAGH